MSDAPCLTTGKLLSLSADIAMAPLLVFCSRRNQHITDGVSETTPCRNRLKADGYRGFSLCGDCIYPCIIKIRRTQGKIVPYIRFSVCFAARKGKRQNLYLPSYRGRRSSGILRSALSTTFRAHSSVLGCLRATSGDAETIARATSSGSYPSMSSVFAVL